jgi:V/A-type H+-transporting ATPase subunit E
MSLNTLADEIGSSAKDAAKKVKSAAKKEAKAIQKEAQGQVDDYHADVMARTDRSSQQLSVETVAAARQANQQRLLVARREELDTTWNQVIETVSSAKFKGRSEMLNALVGEAMDAGAEGMTLRPVSKDRKALEQAAKSIDFGDDIDGVGGFVLESKDGSVLMDYRFEGRLRTAWENSLGDVSTILFGE